MTNPTILLLEWNEVLRRNLKGTLLCQGFELVESFEQAGILRSVRDRSPDLVILASSREGAWDGLELAHWNKSQAAQKLRWSRMTLYRKMEKYHLLSRGKDLIHRGWN